jgi:hypothetical protein
MTYVVGHAKSLWTNYLISKVLTSENWGGWLFIFDISNIKKLAREVKVGAGSDDKQAFFVEWPDVWHSLVCQY